MFQRARGDGVIRRVEVFPRISREKYSQTSSSEYYLFVQETITVLMKKSLSFILHFATRQKLLEKHLE